MDTCTGRKKASLERPVLVGQLQHELVNYKASVKSTIELFSQLHTSSLFVHP